MLALVKFIQDQNKLVVETVEAEKVRYKIKESQNQLAFLGFF
jgi:hypothetical protein